ncbi:MAG: hypothetical protein Q9169_004156 [Polycauliona sp. 2 TL-2023]
MGSRSSQSIYQRYKHDTEVVASWLACTAKAFRCTAGTQDFSTNTVPSIPTRKLKGKAKAEAAKTPSHDLFEHPESTKPKYTLAIKDFVPLAEHIVAAPKDTKFKIPHAFSAALGRVILVRRQFAEKLEGIGRHFDNESDTRHRFFINILEKVRKTLEPLIAVDSIKESYTKDDGTTKATEENHKCLSGLVGDLHIHEASTGSEAAPDVELSPPIPLECTVDAAEGLRREAAFAMVAFMEDLARLRIEIAELWKKYEAGEMDIAPVSVATNTLSSLHGASRTTLLHGGSTDSHYKYFCAVSGAMGFDAQAKQKPTDHYNLAAYDVADASFCNTLFNIIDFVQVNPLHKFCYHMDPEYDWYDEGSVCTGKSPRQGYFRIQLALRELLADLSHVPQTSSPIEDQLLNALITTLRTAKIEKKATPNIPIWFSFAARIYLDTLNVVKIGKGWTDMQRVILNVKQSVGHLPTSWPERGMLLGVLGLWGNGVDPIARRRQSLREPYKDYTFLRRHFMHCGLWVHVLRTLFHQQCVNYIESSDIVMSATQLYHALRREQRLCHAWTDLDTLRRLQGDPPFFASEPPTSFEGYCNNFCQTTGLSMINWALSNHDKKLEVPTEDKTPMRYKGVTSAVLASRSSYPNDGRPITADEVEDWIQRSDYSHGNIKTESSPTPTARRSQVAPPLLHRLAAMVTKEIADLEFDYITVHQLCREFLLRLQVSGEKVLDPDLAELYMCFDKLSLGYVAGFVFLTVVENNVIMESNVSTMRLWEIAAETMNQWLSEGKGSVITGTASGQAN